MRCLLAGASQRSMALYERDYYRSDEGRRYPSVRTPQTVVGWLILINIAVWILQVLTGGEHGWVTHLFQASGDSVFNLHVYKLVTANFAHDPTDVFHLAWNMLFLFFFGRELEQIYGRKDFLTFYLLAGSLAVLVEVVSLGLSGSAGVPVLGASGAVMGVVVLFTLFYPHRQILFMLFVPMPIWVLCVIFVASDLLAVLRGTPNGVANLAHLTGAAVGLGYWYYNLRWRRWGGSLPSLRIPNPFRRREAKIITMPRRTRRDAPPEVRQVSKRIDELLAKISREGKESLTEEEWEFLKENSASYRSEPQ